MWKDVWERKGNVKLDGNVSLNKLIEIDGFDTTTGTMEEGLWLEYVEYVLSKIKIDNKISILEIGCGNGAFLYALKKLLNDKIEHITGVDYCGSLIKIAKKVMPEHNFYECEASNIDKMFHDKTFDIIVSNSVFQYFPTKEYAANVINSAIRMLSKNGSIILLDLNDIEKKNIYHSKRKGNMTDEEYHEKYNGLDHLFFSKEELYNLFDSSGFENVLVEDQKIDGYKNSELRFNIFALNKK